MLRDGQFGVDVNHLFAFLSNPCWCIRRQQPVSELLERAASLPDDHSELVPPDPISNSVVKRLSADGSVGDPMGE